MTLCLFAGKRLNVLALPYPTAQEPGSPGMVEMSSILGVAAIALGMVLTPGPNMMYLLSRSVTQGRRAGLISLAGVAVGFLVYPTAATFGLSALFAAVPELYLTVKFAGAAYLLWLAWQALRPGGRPCSLRCPWRPSTRRARSSPWAC